LTLMTQSVKLPLTGFLQRSILQRSKLEYGDLDDGTA
ncbi:MAG: hypothetical protein ACJAXU_001982, partial [Paracoccaceae bacterium]